MTMQRAVAKENREGRRLRILLADAHRDGARPERWERHGFQAVVAHDALEALERFRDAELSLVVLDDRLPGFELSGLVRILRSTARGPSVPVLLVIHGNEGANEAAAVGADDYVHAPTQRGRLPEVIEHAVAMNHWSPK